MKDISRFEYWLLQNLSHSPDLKNKNEDISIGSLAKYIQYKINNPLSAIINVDLSPNSNQPVEFNTFFVHEKQPKLQYVKRLPGTPFYVSYLVNSNLAIKVIDFYNWQPDTVMYRFMILKRLKASSMQNGKIQFAFNNSISEAVQSNTYKTANAYLFFSGKGDLRNNQLIYTIPDTDLSFICLAISSNPKEKINLKFNSITKLFHHLYEQCQLNHINKIFSVKNNSADRELDNLWSRQKYFYPDRTIDWYLLNQTQENSDIIIWIIDFLTYFGLKDDLNQVKIRLGKKETTDVKSIEYDLLEKVRINNHVKQKPEYQNTGSELTDYGALLNYYFIGEIDEGELIKILQQWWNYYSLPFLSNVLKFKVTHNSFEIFAVYFLAIRHQMPWAPFLMTRINEVLVTSKKKCHHDFFLLLSFFYERIVKWKTNNNLVRIHSGYKWDNNYKALEYLSDNLLIQYTKFSHKIYFTLTQQKKLLLRIDKLCGISMDHSANSIHLYPLIFNVENAVEIRNYVQITVNNQLLKLPLIWKSGELIFHFVRFKWILKKNRFQFTFLSKIDQSICLNGSELFLEKGRKKVMHQEAKYFPAELNINIYNSEGRSSHSAINSFNKKILIIGYALTNYGILSDNIAVKTLSKHRRKIDSHLGDQIYEKIPIENKITKIEFFAKRAHLIKDLIYYNSYFIDKLAHSDKNFELTYPIFLIDPQFSNNSGIIDQFIYLNFRFHPELIIDENGENIQQDVSPIIFIKKGVGKTAEKEICFLRKNLLIINAEKVEKALVSFINFTTKNLVK